MEDRLLHPIRDAWPGILDRDEHALAVILLHLDRDPDPRPAELGGVADDVGEDLGEKVVPPDLAAADPDPDRNIREGGDFPLDENGVPLGYTQVLTGQKATGYSARDGAYGAAVYSSARSHPDVGECVAGTVAVNPNVIPYGTRMYIRTPDGKFVYGYAIANDTGTGMMQGVVSVDLFYDTYTESLLNSVRYVDIYILD